MIVYLAEYNYQYEGSDLVGIYSRMDKAKEACEKDYNEPGKSLEWGQAEGREGNLVAYDMPSDNTYTICPIEVDA